MPQDLYAALAGADWQALLNIYGPRTLLSLLTLIFGWWLISQLVSRVRRLLERRNFDPAMSGFVTSLAGIAMKLMLLLSAASTLGIQTTSFVAMLGAAGLAIGLALQGSLANFAGGVLILILRPFRSGDWIEARGVSGAVSDIQIFHTVLRTADNRTVIVPNGSLSNDTIINYSREKTRRVEITVGIDYSADIRVARQVLLEIARDERVLSEPAEPVVHVTALGDNAVNLSLRVWVRTPDFWPVTFAFTEQAKLKLDEVGIGIPFPQRVVHLVQH